MDNLESKKNYIDLVIEAKSKTTEIWLGDDEGHFVQKDIGVLKTSLLSGNYTVEFDLGTNTYPIKLDKAKNISEFQLLKGPTCVRPIPKV